MKRDHESSRRIGAQSQDSEGDLIAIGPDVIAVGSVVRSSPDGVRVRLSHFVEGSGRDLWSLGRGFDQIPPGRRYALLNELGFGDCWRSRPSSSAWDMPMKCSSGSGSGPRAGMPLRATGSCPARMVACFEGWMPLGANLPLLGRLAVFFIPDLTIGGWSDPRESRLLVSPKMEARDR